MSLRSFYVTTENATGSQANALDGVTNLTSPSARTASVTSSSWPAIRIDQTQNQALTCFATGFYLVQTKVNGSVGYEYNPIPGVYSGSDNNNTFPFKLYKSATEYNTLDYALSATGQECASGLQTVVAYWTISATALTATSAGVELIDVANNELTFNNGATYAPVISAQTNVWCVNTPFPTENPVYFCQGEFARKQQYMG